VADLGTPNDLEIDRAVEFDTGSIPESIGVSNSTAASILKSIGRRIRQGDRF
jgi:hypothetical protein